MPTPRPAQLAGQFIETQDFRVADLHFVRPNDHPSTHNPIAMSRINLCPHNSQNFCLLRPLNDADHRLLRHFHPFLTNKPHTMSSLPLCAVAKPPSAIALPTTHRLPPT